MASMDVPAGGSTIKTAKAIVTSPAFISWTALAFMTTGSVASLRSSPTMAVYGLACVFLYVVPAIVFLLPQALVAAELASGWSGGVYRWVTEGLSGPWGLLAIWCQFAMTIFYYPTLLAFVASTLAYIFNPDLASNGVYTGVVIVVVFWAGVFVSARGMDAIAKLASSGLIIGTLIPGSVRDAGLLGLLRALRGQLPGPDRGHHAGDRVDQRHARLARRAVEGPADDRPPGGLPAADPAEDQRPRHPGQHPRRAGLGDDRDRADVRADPGRLERLLDPERDDDPGLSRRLPADVRRRGPAAQERSPTSSAATARRRCRSCASWASWPRPWPS